MFFPIKWNIPDLAVPTIPPQTACGLLDPTHEPNGPLPVPAPGKKNAVKVNFPRGPGTAAVVLPKKPRAPASVGGETGPYEKTVSPAQLGRSETRWFWFPFFQEPRPICNSLGGCLPRNNPNRSMAVTHPRHSPAPPLGTLLAGHEPSPLRQLGRRGAPPNWAHGLPQVFFF